MRPSKIKEVMGALWEIKIPTFLWGPPGIGKTAIVYETALEKGYGVMVFHASLYDPTDFKGLGIVKEDRTLWCPPQNFPFEGKWVFFLDELNIAPHQVQGVCLPLIQSREIGNYKMPPDCTIVGAGNRECDDAFARHMGSAMRDRWHHFRFEPHIDDYIRWAWGHDIDERIIAFLYWRPDRLYTFDPDSEEISFGSPRAYERLSKVLQATRDLSLTEKERLELIAGDIGETVGVEFFEFCNNYERIPRFEEIVENAREARIPEEPSLLYAVCCSLIAKVNPETLRPVVEYSKRIPAEYRSLLRKDIAIRKPELAATKEFVQWAMI